MSRLFKVPQPTLLLVADIDLVAGALVNGDDLVLTGDARVEGSIVNQIDAVLKQNGEMTRKPRS